MGSLVDKLMGIGAVMGLAGCITGTKPQTEETKSIPVTQPVVQTLIEVPAGVDYTQIGWDRAHYTAGTINDCRGPEIHLFYLRFESDLGDEKTRLIRVLDEEELTRLGIRTRQDLFQYLEGKAKKHSGYIGPNKFI